MNMNMNMNAQKQAVQDMMQSNRESLISHTFSLCKSSGSLYRPPNQPIQLILEAYTPKYVITDFRAKNAHQIVTSAYVAGSGRIGCIKNTHSR
jgi:hypothetical protein